MGGDNNLERIRLRVSDVRCGGQGREQAGMESKRNDEWLRAIALSLIQFHGYLRREKQRLVKSS